MAGADRKEIVNVPLADFYKVITDYASYPDFVSGVKKVKVLPDDGKFKRVEFDLEMMKRVHYVLKIDESMDAARGEARVHWTLESSDLFKSNNGGWTLKAVDGGKTEAVYKLDLEFNISVPGFLLKGMVSNALPAAIKEFAGRAEKMRKG